MQKAVLMRANFGDANVFSPLGCGYVIEDIWPSLYIGAERVPEMKRKVGQLQWAGEALELWKQEAEIILQEIPSFVVEKAGGRSAMHTDSGHYLIFDPQSQSPMWDPLQKEFVEPRGAARDSWVTLQHERVRRLMTSLGFLWQLTGDERYCAWVWRGLKNLVALYNSNVDVSEQQNKNYRIVYGGLYEAQCMMQVIQALELVDDAPGITEADIDEVKHDILLRAGEMLSAWMDVMVVHNMSCWAMAALAELGRVCGRDEWIDKAFHSERCGLKMLLEKGLPRNEETGSPDGFWYEHSPFYGCFYVITSLIPLYRAAEKAGALDADLRERFQSFFDAPFHLVDPELRLLSISDRVAPGTMRLTQARHLFEFATGQLDAANAPALAFLYQHCGASRNSLTAVAYGLDELPNAEPPPKLLESCVLPEAQLVTFRGQTDKGQVTCWFNNLKRYANGAQGHHHMDKLSISLHAYGEVVTSDLGWPGQESENVRKQYLPGTLSHNTLMLDEMDQGPMTSVAFDCDLDAPVPWACGAVKGNSDDQIWKTFEKHHGGRMQEGLYDDAILKRTVWFDCPYVILLDELDAEREKRLGFAFHCRGSMRVSTPGNGKGDPLGLPALPTDGAWSCFEGRYSADPVHTFVADWRVRSDIFLRAITVCDRPFEANWGHTPDNPAEIRRGTIFLRARGETCRFATVLELHQGAPSVADVSINGEGRIDIRLFDGTSKALSV